MIRDVMARLDPRRRPDPSGPLDTEGLAARVAGLTLAARVADGRLPDAVVAQAQEVLATAAARRELSGDLTVVALAGATGVGKSSIFNSLVGQDVARASVIRPTTAHPLAAVWGQQPAALPLLDWLAVPQWHVVDDQPSRPSGTDSPPLEAPDPDGPQEPLSGLVLVDLPDNDSTEVSHREQVDRLVSRVDMMVWVLDPQKYADAVVHDQYLRHFARHADVTVVVLNQVDTLTAEQADQCLVHLRSLLAADGLSQARVLGASARTGQGMADLRRALAEAAAQRRAALARTAADVATAADALADAAGDTGATLPIVDRETTSKLAATLADAAGVDVVCQAVADSVRRSGRVATGWPATRWLALLGRDRLSDLRLSRPGVPADLTRTSMPSADPVAIARAAAAVRDYAAAASTGAPPAWVRSSRVVALQTVEDMVPELDAAIAAAQVAAPRRPRWWALVGALQWLFLAVAAAGGAWLLGLLGLAALAFDPPAPPTVGGLPAPTVMLISGALIGVVLAAAAALVNRAGAARAARAARESITSQIADVVRIRVTEPIGADLGTLEDFRVGLLAARSG